MNIRIENHHLRFRVTQTEMQQLLNGATLLTDIPLPDLPSFSYALCTDNSIDALTLQSEQGTLKLLIPKSAAEALAAGRSRTGISNEQNLNDGACLQLSLEVDIRKRRNT